MSNPNINRWGLNLFWYRFWYNDKINALTIHQDDLIEKLILLYLHYGLLYPKNIFIAKYWFFDHDFDFKNFYKNFSLKYFRTVQYKNKIFKENRLYKLRNKIKNLYFSKLWILRYQNWIIINFYCFQPLITKKKYNTILKKNLNFYLSNSNNKMQKYTIKRYKILIIYVLNNLLNKNLYYKF